MPDFLIIPKIVHDCQDLQPADWIVYAVIYWYEHMRDGKCTAANGAIAQIAGVGERAVRGALDRLEQAGFIKRIFRDKKRKDRAQILSLVRFTVMSQTDMPAKEDIPKGPPVPEVIKETPADYAKRFFSGDPQVIGELGKQCEDAGIPQTFVIREMVKFKNYWTEPSQNGKKVRWELEKFFDVKRRLGTWFRKAAETSKNTNRAGSGREV